MSRTQVLQGDQIAFRYPDQTNFLFQNATFSITLSGTTPARIGLVGPNGEGKTTLLRLLAGELTPSQGRLITPREGVRIAVQPQRLLEASEALTLDTFLREPLSELTALEAELSLLEEQLARITDEVDDEKVLLRYGELQSRYETLGGYDLEARMERVLSGLGLGEVPLERRMHTLSSGQKTRAALARMLLAPADLLLFDEPTNHLDREAIEWLEHSLADSLKAFVVVSHDRAFLDVATSETWSVHGGLFETYPGAYSAFEAFRGERNAQLAHEREVQKREVKRLEASLHERAGWSMRRESEKNGHGVKRTEPKDRGFIGARSAAQMKRALAIRTRIEHELESKKIALPQVEEERILTFPEVNDLPGVMARLDGVTARYDGPPVLDQFDLEVRAGERLLITGPNGSGKSTILRLLAGLLVPDQGTVHHHPRTRLHLFSQEQAELLGRNFGGDSETPVRALLDVVAEPKQQGKARLFLGYLGIRGDEVFRPVNSLSPGEVARAALVRCLLSDANLILLDEPTNHLDLQAREALERGLLSYQGALVVVTHDLRLRERLGGREIRLAT